MVLVGAKLSGGGGGGSVVALCPDSSNQVARAIEKSGYKSISVRWIIEDQMASISRSVNRYKI